MKEKKITLSNTSLLPQGNPYLISGPCVIENQQMLIDISSHLKEITKKLGYTFVFKASFDKANRSSIKGFRGPGLEKGLEMLKNVKSQVGVPITSDVHTPDMIAKCSGILDIVQIPAFLARQTDFYVEAAKANMTLTVKKGQFMSPDEMSFAIEKFRNSSGKGIAIIERGTFFGYNNLIVDFRNIPIIKKMGVPYIYDATHSLQRPAAGNGVSLGNREFLEPLARAQLAAGADGLFIETHPNPAKAKSDAATQYPLNEMSGLLSRLLPFFQ